MTAASDPAEIAAAMRAVIDQHTSDGPYVPRRAAEEIVEKLRANDPDLLAAWLDTQAAHFVWDVINRRDHSRRAVTNHAAKSGVFREVAAAHAAGDSTQLVGFLAAPYTIADGSRRTLGTLTHDDLLFVAARYNDRARDNALRGAFMKALAKRVKNGTVADHFDEARLVEVWDSLAAA